MNRDRARYALAAICFGLPTLVSGLRLLAPALFTDLLALGPDPARIRAFGENWHQIYVWNFADGEPADAWGWGTWRMTEGALELNDPETPESVWFVTADHGADFLLETDVRVETTMPDAPLEIHLITRDSHRMHNETGLALIGTQGDAYFRCRAQDAEYIEYGSHCDADLDDDQWHRLRLACRRGQVAAELDGKPLPMPPTNIPATAFREPHLAVRNGTARFRNLIIATPRAVAALPARPSGIPGADVGDLPGRDSLVVLILKIIFYTVIALICLYLVRHYVFTLNRLVGRQRHPYLDVRLAHWPAVTVLVPAHNEEEVVASILESLTESDYPAGNLTIIPINDRSEDDTGKIMDAYAAEHPGLIRPFHRTKGEGGKAAALEEAMAMVEDEIVLVFDADYVPGRGLIRQLVAPFFDPEVGAVMGRVVPYNTDVNLLTRLLDLERSGGYQVDQQARMNLDLVPQYGGTVGGIRRTALDAVGGWRLDCLAEDTEVTMRLALAGWKTVYQNRSECYEEVPSTWDARIKQIRRWAYGHNQVYGWYFGKVMRSKRMSRRQRVDAGFLLGTYAMAPILLLGWLVGMALWYLGINKPGLIIILMVTCYSSLGNFALFFEIAAATRLDGSGSRVRLLPWLFLSFVTSLLAVTRTSLGQLVQRRRRGTPRWVKTRHVGRSRA